jgi:hypothetical protein
MDISASFFRGLILLCQINTQARHARREAGIQCHGWQAQIHPWSLDSLRALTGPAIHAGMTILDTVIM